MTNTVIFLNKSADDKTIVDLLAAALRKDIAFGNLLPDQKLKLNDLRSRYGGSNHSMRETLRMLTVEGLVEATAQRGFRVTSATQEDLCDIQLVRTEIEALALSRAIELGDIAWEGRVIAAHHALQKAEDKVMQVHDDVTALEWDEACRAFASALLDACGSRRLIDLHRKYFDQSRRFRLAQLREGRLNWCARKKRQKALLDAVLARDASHADALLRQDIKAELQSA
ncbi:GntR family transcriptional regulator [uncultured Tateyamaria sp.]|uniref:GntR family transcriptional regulator n=1 Tax=Tateyamaria sp. 1078 TaxID=3417464 RepID=UPI002608681E|nr:GntR family transcriptional regulator [uncultured Tateyamaria sp.]